jgi:hypothetical protein
MSTPSDVSIDARMQELKSRIEEVTRTWYSGLTPLIGLRSNVVYCVPDEINASTAFLDWDLK